MLTSKKKIEPSRSALEKAVKDGLTYRQMAKLFSMQPGSVMHALKREGLYVPGLRSVPNAKFVICLAEPDIDLLAKLRRKLTCHTNSETMRRALRKAAVVAGVLKEERE